MFELGLTDEERLIQETARRFAAERLAPRIREHERARGVGPGLAAEFSALGLASLDLPPEAGGQGMGAVAKALVLEELAAADAGAALALDPLGPALYPLLECGRSELLTGALSRVCIIDDPEERFHSDGRAASGSSPWVPADELAGLVILQPGRALVVTEGIELEKLQPCGLEAAGASLLRLRAAPVVGVLDDAAALERARARIRVHVAALLVGVARAAREYATRYATERTAFGRPIGHHQALAFLIVDMATAVDAARMAVWRAAATIDGGKPASWEGAVAFAEAAEQALFVGPSAVQVLGGHGFMKDHPVEKYMRDIRTLASMCGGRDGAEMTAAELAPEREVGLR